MSLPEPSFIDRDPAVITAEMRTSWQALTGKTLYPGQVEGLLIDLIAYRETLVRIGIQEAAKQNLVAFARAPMLDYLGELVGVYRLEGEDDNRLRERIKLAPESYTTAGSRGSYIFHAMSADASIVDVWVTSPTPGVVTIFPLVTAGVPGQSILDAVAAECSADDVRPLTDQVFTLPPTQIDYAIAVTLETYLWPEQAVIQPQAETALAALSAELSGGLGMDVTLTRIIAAAAVQGVYRVTVTSPAADVIVGPTAFSHCTAITVNMGAMVNG